MASSRDLTLAVVPAIAQVTPLYGAMSGWVITITRTCFVFGLLAITGCISPHPDPEVARNGKDCPLLTGTWGELDTGAAFTFSADGTFRMTEPGIPNSTRTGTYKTAGPDAAILTFSASSPGSGREQVKYYYLVLKNGTRLIATESGALDSIKKAQK